HPQPIEKAVLGKGNDMLRQRIELDPGEQLGDFFCDRPLLRRNPSRTVHGFSSPLQEVLGTERKVASAHPTRRGTNRLSYRCKRRTYYRNTGRVACGAIGKTLRSA